MFATKVIPKIYGYFLILLGMFLSNVEAIPILLVPRANESTNNEENKQQLIQKIIGAIAIATGFCICFFGYQLYNRIIFFIGFICGVFLTKSIISSVFGEVSDTFFYISAIIIGIILGSVALCAYKVSLCILGALAGYGVAAIIIAFVPSVAEKVNPLIITIILAIVFIILINVMEIPIIIVATGIVGSFLMFYGTDTLINTGFAHAIQTMYDSKSFALFNSNNSVKIMVTASLLISVLGWVVQFISYKHSHYKQ
ncbi:hypothetical protein BCR36DRAFT_352628 [Piromyces finnis]|uniref:Transmembrane protein 198 n=1 Tax=Piromyces finnis TaxID=1754191 RepID=A0A1Y1VAP0_9FUNG|nr:hypothetical protein BCR36DRAFT_352628 [Piromyces finnis]|eukprot:ORX50395.1 hypothetical protein BCR36DRAFT_352628 [Piromyces finnis]